MTIAAPRAPEKKTLNREPAPRRFSWRRRILLRVIPSVGSIVIRLLCCTLRYRRTEEPGAPLDDRSRPMIWVFWHNCILPATYRFRNHELAVLASRSFDGECISRLIERFGYRALRGSSSHGGVGAMLAARREIELGRAVAFTIDGPRGPRHVAKPGPLLLARVTGIPVVAFHVAVERAWTLPTWDRMIVPKPFSRALVRVSAPILVASDDDAEQMDRLHAELQAALERVEQDARSEVARSK